MKKPRKMSTTPTIAMSPACWAWRRRTCIATVAPDAAAPGLVAGDVGVLLLERLVAGPRRSRARDADDDEGHARDEQDDVDDAHGPLASLLRPRRRLAVQALPHGRLDEGGVG